ncbi:retrovirus-related pol polyprotein from transposon TNT 1-94 [Tanacetum coccineum]
MDSIKPRVLAPGRYDIDVKPIPPHNRNNMEVHLDYLKHLKDSVETLREIVEEAKVERPLDRSLASAFLYTKHSQELLEYVIGTCPKDFNQQDKKHVATPLTRKMQVTFEDQCETSNRNTHKHVEQLNIQKTNVPLPPYTGVNSCTEASGSQPKSNTKKNKILPAKSANKKKVEEHPRTNKSSLKTTNHVDYSISSQRTVVQIILWYLDSGCSKHMTGDRSRLRNFVKKFIRTVKFWNDHFGAIMGYGDYVIGDSVISRHSCYVRDMEVSFRKHSCYHRLNHLNFDIINDLTRKDLVRGLPRLNFEKDHLCFACQLGKSKKHTYSPKTKNTNLEVLNTLHMDLCGPMRVQTINGKKYILVIVDDYSRFTWVKFLRSKDETPKVVIKFLKQIQVVPRTPQQNGIVERRNRTLVEAARTMLIFSKAPMFLWAEAIATAFGTVAYRLELPEKLSRVHSTFHVSNLKKCLSDEPLAIPLDEIHVDDKLNFIEEPIEIMDREVKRLKQSRIPIVKVRWNSRRGPEYTWEREDQMQKKYPHLFANHESASHATS